MSDMYGAVRSNWFKVKDFNAFRAWFDENVSFGGETELWHDADEGVAFGGYEQYPSAWPNIPPDPEGDTWESEQWDLEEFAAKVREFLLPGESLRVLAAGHEKLRYVGATHLVVPCEGAAVFTNLYEGN